MNDLIRNYILKCMSLIYLTAFGSLYCQSPGLYGDNGILPVRLVVPTEPKSFDQFLSNHPTLLSFAGRLGLTVQQGFDFLCLIGIALSILSFVSASMCSSLSFMVLWALYFSLYQVGQTFLWFQWDILLLEAGVLSVLFAINWSKDVSDPHHRMGFFLFRWLLFRLMFSSGVVKLTSECPTWWGLTALDWHYESQCIPTSLAWYFHHLPSWFQRLSVAATFLIEIPLPFLFFSPIRNLRLFAFCMQLLLQVLIILTGNYNFFNLLTITLCLSLLEDRDVPRIFRKTGYGNSTSQISVLKNVSSIMSWLCSVLVYGGLTYGVIKYFDLRLIKGHWEIQSRIVFSKAEFYEWLRKAVPLGIYVGLLALLWNIVQSLVSCLQMKGSVAKFRSLGVTIGVCFMSVFLFLASLVPYTSIEENSHSQLPMTVIRFNRQIRGFSMVNSYGLFRSMTGVGGRPEVVIQGSESGDPKSWKEYEFLYKPGNVSRRLPFVAPHQPRLDWQMWFAALGSYQHNPWFINLVYRLLTNEPHVLELIEKNPFPRHPPKYIRAISYIYHYTKPNRRKTSNPWWIREYSHEYLPPVSLEQSGLITYLRQTGIIGRQPKERSRNVLTHFIKSVRNFVGQPEGFSFTMSLLISSVLIRVLGISVGIF